SPKSSALIASRSRPRFIFTGRPGHLGGGNDEVRTSRIVAGGGDGALGCRFVARLILIRRQLQACTPGQKVASPIPVAAARGKRPHEIALRAERAGAIAARAETRSGN